MGRTTATRPDPPVQVRCQCRDHRVVRPTDPAPRQCQPVRTYVKKNNRLKSDSRLQLHVQNTLKDGVAWRSSDRDRAMLYLSYVQSWYRDVINFKDRHTSSWDTLPTDGSRGLFAHLDTMSYVERLENFVHQMAGGSKALRELQSKRKFNMIDLTI